MQDDKKPRRTGRPKLMAESVKVNLRVTPQQRDKLTQLGGAPWVRSQIDAAKAPQPKEKT